VPTSEQPPKSAKQSYQEHFESQFTNGGTAIDWVKLERGIEDFSKRASSASPPENESGS
jgi:hypothetical protein